MVRKYLSRKNFVRDEQFRERNIEFSGGVLKLKGAQLDSKIEVGAEKLVGLQGRMFPEEGL